MVDRWQTKRMMILFGVISGGLVSLAFVRPYEKEIALAELVLQLSGARGAFAMGCTLPDLVRFMLRMVPNMLVVMMLGSQLYRHFCTASVYVFSRYPNRLQWYLKSLASLLANVCFFELIFVTSTVLAAMPRYRILFSKSGVLLLGFHALIYTAWIFGWVLMTNLFAIRLGSSRSFMAMMTAQAVCTATLAFVRIFERNGMSAEFIKLFIEINPVAHTVLSWHQGAPFGEALAHSRYDLSPLATIMLLIILDIVIVLAGAAVAGRYDLLSENRETEED